MRSLQLGALAAVLLSVTGCQEEEYCWRDGFYDDDGNWVSNECCNDDCSEGSDDWSDFDYFDGVSENGNDELEDEDNFSWSSRAHLSINRQTIEAVEIDNKKTNSDFIKVEVFVAADFLSAMTTKSGLKALVTETHSADASYISLNELPADRPLLLRLTSYLMTGVPIEIGLKHVRLKANEIEDVDIEMQPYGVWVTEIKHGDLHQAYSTGDQKRLNLRYVISNNTSYSFEKVEAELIVLDSRISASYSKDAFQGTFLPFTSNVTSARYKPQIELTGNWEEAEIHVLVKINGFRFQDSKAAEYQHIHSISFKPEFATQATKASNSDMTAPSIPSSSANDPVVDWRKSWLFK